MLLPSTVPAMVPDWRGPLNVPVIVPPTCLITINWSALPASPLTLKFQVPATLAGPSAAATHTARNTTAKAANTFIRKFRSRIESLLGRQRLPQRIAPAGEIYTRPPHPSIDFSGILRSGDFN